MSGADPIRVVVWSTGGIGANVVQAIARRPDLELVGVWVHNPEKVGRDAGELSGGPPLGIVATHDADALIALQPDCVVYAASGPERDAVAVPDYEVLLRAGINVVTTTSTRLVFPPVYEQEARDRLAAAAAAGRASLYASGLFPGFASDQLALVLTTQSKSIRTVRTVEISLNDHYPVASVMADGMGFGRPLDFEPHLSRPGYIPMAWQAPIQLIARGLGVELEEIRGQLDRCVTPRAIEVGVRHHRGRDGRCGAHQRPRNRRRPRSDRRRACHSHGARHRARLALVGPRRHLPDQHRRRARCRSPARARRPGRARRRPQRDDRHRDARRQRDSVRRRRGARIVELARPPDRTLPRQVFS